MQLRRNPGNAIRGDLMPSLLLGCGNDRIKKVQLPGKPEWVEPLVTLDMDPNCGADVLHDLDVRPLPFRDNTFDEMGAFDVLEHVGRQGDWKGYFEEFRDYWRILKPGGLFFILVPVFRDWFADPGHTRFFSQNHFGFLSQKFYADNLAAGTAVTDYRWFWKRDFAIVDLRIYEDHHLAVILRKEPS